MVIYFWQNMPAMHQVPYQKELVRMGHRVVLCVDHLMLPERAAMGWLPEDTAGIELHVGLNVESSLKLMHSSPLESVHLISGIRGVANGAVLTQEAYESGRRACWINESWDTRGWRGALRGVLYGLESMKYRKKIFKIFAMGDMGVRNYRGCGYGFNQVSEFNYVVPYVPSDAVDKSLQESFIFGYVGALISRKRVDVLLRALSRVSINERNWCLQIHGDGPECDNLKKIADELGIADRVLWCGKFDSADAPKIMSGLNTLVLPSDFDGWGAVVNEALLSGVPVITSDACGSSCLALRHNWGRVFKVGNIDSCAQACYEILKTPPLVNPFDVDAVIGPRATAERLLSAISHEKNSR